MSGPDPLSLLLVEMRAMRAELAPVLDAILAGQRAIETRLAALEAPRAGSSRGEFQRQALGPLLRQVARLVGGATFVCADVTAHEAANSELREAITGAIGAKVAGRERRLGAFLRRGAGIVVEGLKIERLGEARDGAVWMIRGAGAAGAAGARSRKTR